MPQYSILVCKQFLAYYNDLFSYYNPAYMYIYLLQHKNYFTDSIFPECLKSKPDLYA